MRSDVLKIQIGRGVKKIGNKLVLNSNKQGEVTKEFCKGHVYIILIKDNRFLLDNLITKLRGKNQNNSFLCFSCFY